MCPNNNVLLSNIQVKFVGESVDDCGGGYSESIAEMCDELGMSFIYQGDKMQIKLVTTEKAIKSCRN